VVTELADELAVVGETFLLPQMLDEFGQSLLGVNEFAGGAWN